MIKSRGHGGDVLERKKYVLKPRPVPQKIFTDLDEEQQNAVVNSDNRALISFILAFVGSSRQRHCERNPDTSVPVVVHPARPAQDYRAGYRQL